MSWPKVKLKEIFHIARGGSPRPISDYITEDADGLNWISIKDASKSDKYITQTKLKIKKEGLNKSRMVREGDFLLTNSMSFGRPYIMKTDGCIHDGWLVLSGEPMHVNQDYFYHLFGSEILHRKFSSLAAGAVVKNLNIDLVKNVEIPLPPIAEQQQIATILDAADSLRQKDQQLIDHYTALSQSLFLDMFGELESTKIALSELCEINPKKSEISNLGRSLVVSFIPMSNVSEEGDIDLSEERAIGDVWSGFTYFAENDVVFAKITPCMENGKGAVMRGLKNSIGFGTTEFHVLRPVSGKTLPEWLYYLTTQPFFRKLAEANMTGSAGQKRVPKKFFDSFMVARPSIELQNKFAERIVIIEEQKQKARASLEKSEALFNSLLQRAFNGELTGSRTKAA